MQSNRSSVMNNLYKIGDKISEATTGKDVSAADQTSSSPAGHANAPVSQSATLNKALLRRYDDLLKSKRDLTGRLVAECEAVRHSHKNAGAVMEITEAALKQLEEYLDTVQKSDNDFDPADQRRLAEECRKIEIIRIEVIRLQARMKNLNENGSSSGSSNVASENLLMELESLTVSQLFRFGWAVFLPLILAAVISALLICVAIILSYNGVFLWR